MAIEEAVVSLLSGVAGGRNHWGRAESISAAAGAYLVLNWTGGPADPTLGLQSGHVVNRLQVDAYAADYRTARTAMDEARAALNGYRGVVAGTTIKAMIAERSRDLPADDAGEVNRLFRRSMDLIVHHDE